MSCFILICRVNNILTAVVEPSKTNKMIVITSVGANASKPVTTITK